MLITALQRRKGFLIFVYKRRKLGKRAILLALCIQPGLRLRLVQVLPYRQQAIDIADRVNTVLDQALESIIAQAGIAR